MSIQYVKAVYLFLNPHYAAQSQTLRIVQGREPDTRRSRLAQDIDLEFLSFTRKVAGHVSGGKTLVDAMAVGAGGHVADRSPLSLMIDS